MKHKKPISLLCALFLSASLSSQAQPGAPITVQVDQPGHKIPPTLWWIFFEDINLSAGGGIYPELVRNRFFENSKKPDDWRLTYRRWKII